MPALLIHFATGSLRLDLVAGQSVRDALDATALRVRAACGGTGACGACQVRLLKGDANPHTLAEYQKLNAGERAAGIRLACQLRPAGDVEIAVEHPAPRSAWKSIPAEDLMPSPGALPDLEKHIYGLAVDLGTTHIRVSLWDRKRGHRIASRRGPNPQGSFGADVLNRLEAAHASPRRAAELALLARSAIVQAVRDILARDVGEVKPMLAQIGAVTIAGNTPMLALLTGSGIAELLDPAHWQSPIDVAPRDGAAFQAGWFMPNAVVTVLPPLAGFVGSDLLADLAATRLIVGTVPQLLLDVGTNNEIALWDGEWLRVTSVPGGPAFEAVGIRNGMPAEDGAICRVRRLDGGFACDVVGGGAARGFCGSGLVDAVAILLEAGVLKPSGRFAAAPGSEGFPLQAGNPRSALTPIDIDAFQRAKAATAAAMDYLMDDAGLAWGDLGRIYICGAFGRMLNIGNAQTVGLLPPVSRNRIELLADATLAGCELALLGAEGATKSVSRAGKVRLINLSLAKGYDDLYIDHLRLQPLDAW